MPPELQQLIPNLPDLLLNPALHGVAAGFFSLFFLPNYFGDRAARNTMEQQSSRAGGASSKDAVVVQVRKEGEGLGCATSAIIGLGVGAVSYVAQGGKLPELPF